MKKLSDERRNMSRTTVTIFKDTKSRLESLCKKKDSYDALINQLIDSREGQK